jgi:ADP-heptose:LPS heptosyltransferase
VARTLPAARSLRVLYPGAHLAWLVEPGSAGVVDASGIVDETLVFPRSDLMEALRAGDGLSFFGQLRSFVRDLRRRRFEIVLDFHGIAKSGLLSRLSGAPLRYGFSRNGAREFSQLFANRRVSLPAREISRYDRNAALVHAVWPAAVASTRPILETTPLASARLAARLRVSGREQADGFVLIHPGTSLGARHKRYAPSAWADVARGLAARGVDVWVVSGVTRDERSLVDRILRESAGAAKAAPETRSFNDFLALLARASVFASADTGPLHAASMAGVPVVQLLGPTHPIQNEPWPETPWRRVHVPLSCSPCRRGCAEAPCMKILPPATVIEAITALYSRDVQSARRAERSPG